MNTNAQTWLAQGKFFRFENLDIYYRTLGQGTVVFLLHGYPYSSYDFKVIAPELAKRRRVVLLDFPGMGFSDKPTAHQYTFAEYAAILNALAKRLAIDEADILAHDLGVSVAQELLAQEDLNSFKIRSVAFMNGGLFTDVYRPRFIQRLLSQSPDVIGAFLSRRISRSAVGIMLCAKPGRRSATSVARLTPTRAGTWRIALAKLNQNLRFIC